MLSVLAHAVRRRRIGLIGWSLGLLGTVALLAVAYPTVRGNHELDRTFAGLSPGVRQLLGLADGGGLTSPVGYLNSQFFANLLPVMLLVFAIGAASWSIAGDEAAGTLELLLANPVSRVRVAYARLVALVALLAVLTVVSGAGLVAMAPATGLTTGLTWPHLIAATVAGALMALSYATVAFVVGAATGSRPLALGVASTLAVLGYLVEGLAAAVPALRPVRSVTPWHWLIDSDPLRHGLTWQAWLLPLAVAVVLGALGAALFARRDLR
ncbi:MAG TPA: ABC transporter permease subunit [Micromonosporaceae bacterium]